MSGNRVLYLLMALFRFCHVRLLTDLKWGDVIEKNKIWFPLNSVIRLLTDMWVKCTGRAAVHHLFKMFQKIWATSKVGSRDRKQIQH